MTAPLPVALQSFATRRSYADFSSGLINGSKSWTTDELPSRRAQISGRNRPSHTQTAVPLSRFSSGTSADSSVRLLSSWSGGFAENGRRCMAVQGFGGIARMWARNELIPQRRNDVSRGNTDWIQETRSKFVESSGGGKKRIFHKFDPAQKFISCLEFAEENDGERQSVMPENGTLEGRGFHFSRMQRETGVVGSQSTKSSSVGVLLGGVLLALGFCALRFSKPAYAENIAVPPTVSSPLNADREVEVVDSKSSEIVAQQADDRVDPVVDVENTAGDSESVAEEFEPPFGEGSDLTNDPAEVLLRSYLEMHPTDKKALQALLFQRLKKGEVNAAMPVLKKLIDIEPDNLEWKYIRAQVDEYAGDLVQARRGFEEVLQVKPLSARAWQGLAVIMHKAGEEEEAVQLLMEAVQKAVDEGQSKEALNLRMLLGQLHTMQGDLEKAMELYKSVVEEDPKDYRPYLCQGLVYSIIGEEAEAEKHFRRYRKLCPKDFPQRGFLDELMLRAKSESGKLNKRMKEEEELKKKGRKPPKVMKQPLASGVSPSKESEKTD